MSTSHLKNLRGQIDPVLTQLALGMKQAEFVAERIMPVVFTDKEGVRVPVFGKARLSSTAPNARWARPAM